MLIFTSIVLDSLKFFNNFVAPLRSTKEQKEGAKVKGFKTSEFP